MRVQVGEGRRMGGLFDGGFGKRQGGFRKGLRRLGDCIKRPYRRFCIVRVYKFLTHFLFMTIDMKSRALFCFG